MIGLGVPARMFNGDALKGCHKPKLIIHGTQDELAPYEQTLQWFEQLPAPKSMVAVRGAEPGDGLWVTGDLGGAEILDVVAWFHRLAHGSEWLLADASAPIAEGGLVGGTVRIWSQDRRLVASGGAQLLCLPGTPPAPRLTRPLASTSRSGSASP